MVAGRLEVVAAQRIQQRFNRCAQPAAASGPTTSPCYTATAAERYSQHIRHANLTHSTKELTPHLNLRVALRQAQRHGAIWATHRDCLQIDAAARAQRLRTREILTKLVKAVARHSQRRARTVGDVVLGPLLCIPAADVRPCSMAVGRGRSRSVARCCENELHGPCRRCSHGQGLSSRWSTEMARRNERCSRSSCLCDSLSWISIGGARRVAGWQSHWLAEFSPRNMPCSAVPMASLLTH